MITRAIFGEDMEQPAATIETTGEGMKTELRDLQTNLPELKSADCGSEYTLETMLTLSVTEFASSTSILGQGFKAYTSLRLIAETDGSPILEASSER